MFLKLVTSNITQKYIRLFQVSHNYNSHHSDNNHLWCVFSQRQMWWSQIRWL